MGQGVFHCVVDRNPHSSLFSQKDILAYTKVHLLFQAAYHSTVFHCQFQLRYMKNELWLGGGHSPCGGWEFWVAELLKGVIIPQGFGYCSHWDKTKWTGLGSLAVFLRLLFWCSEKYHRDHIKNQICGGQGEVKKLKGCEGPDADVLEVELHDIFMALLMVNNISMSTMELLAPSSFFYSPAFLTHTYTAQGEKWPLCSSQFTALL